MESDRLHRPPQVLMATGFVAMYLLLEWATYRADVSPLGITPWNPSAGLSLALLLAQGVRWTPVLALALLLAGTLVRHAPLPWWVELAEIAVTVVSYAAAAALLRRPSLGFDRRLVRMSDLLLLVVVAIAATMLIALAYAGVLNVAGLLPVDDVTNAVLRQWGGDVIGIMAVTPFLLIVPTHGRLQTLSFETVLQGLAILAAVAIVLGGSSGLREHLFYLLFLPVVWIAVRSGLPGAAIGLCVMQVGLMMELHLRDLPLGNVAALQAVLLILLFAGLAIGVLVSERERVTESLRRQQAALARLGRAVGMSSLSSSLTHEISQPLTAIGNFARATVRALDAEPPQLRQAREAAGRAAAQVERATEIVRKLRRLFELGHVDLARQDVAALVSESRALVAAEAADQGVLVETGSIDDRLAVSADRTQIVLVLVNLLRNGIEAVAGAPLSRRRVLVTAVPYGPDRVMFEVSDEGPGFPPDFDLDTHGLGQTDKPQGLGVGLGLCRSIVEAHGGTLSILPRASGAAVAFTLHRVSGGRNAEAA